MRTAINFPGDRIMLNLSETGEVCSLGEILPEQPGGVLVAAALTRTVRVGKVNLDACHVGEQFVLIHLTPLMVVHGQTPLCVDAAEHGSESSDCRISSCMIHFFQYL